MGNKFNKPYEVKNAYEIRAKVNDHTVSVVYGQLSKGGFIAILDWNICVRTDSPTNVLDNALNISGLKFTMPKAAKIVAEAVCEHWESIQKDGGKADVR